MKLKSMKDDSLYVAKAIVIRSASLVILSGLIRLSVSEQGVPCNYDKVRQRRITKKIDNYIGVQIPS